MTASTCPKCLEFLQKNLQNLSEGPNSFGHWHYTYLYYSQVMYRQGNKEWEPFREKLYKHIIQIKNPTAPGRQHRPDLRHRLQLDHAPAR